MNQRWNHLKSKSLAIRCENSHFNRQTQILSRRNFRKIIIWKPRIIEFSCESCMWFQCSQSNHRPTCDSFTLRSIIREPEKFNYGYGNFRIVIKIAFSGSYVRAFVSLIFRNMFSKAFFDKIVFYVRIKINSFAVTSFNKKTDFSPVFVTMTLQLSEMKMFFFLPVVSLKRNLPLHHHNWLLHFFFPFLLIETVWNRIQSIGVLCCCRWEKWPSGWFERTLNWRQLRGCIVRCVGMQRA
jgi:hypothetical protein